MKAAILTMAGIRLYDNEADALFALTQQQGTKVLEAIQQRQPSDSGMLIVIEGYASLQGVGLHEVLLNDVIPTTTSGKDPNPEWLNREVIYFDGQGILGLRVVYTTNPLKRIVYEIAQGEIREAHV